MGQLPRLGARDRRLRAYTDNGIRFITDESRHEPATNARISVDDVSETVRPSKSGDSIRPAPNRQMLTQRTFQSGVPLGHIRLYANECMYC